MIVSDYAEIEKQERQWHRRHAIWRAFETGATIKEIARVMGLNRSRVHALYRRADDEVIANERSPLTRELSRVEFVPRAQIRNAELARTDGPPLLRDIVRKQDARIARLKKQLAELKSENAVLISRAKDFDIDHHNQMVAVVRRFEKARDESRKLRLRVMDDILIARDGHFVGLRPHASGSAFVQVKTIGGIKELPLQSFCVREGDQLHHAFVVMAPPDESDLLSYCHEAQWHWSSVPRPFSSWLEGGQTLPILPEAAQ